MFAHFQSLSSHLFLALLFSALMPSLQAQEITAEQIVANVKAQRPSGSVYARIRMAHRSTPDSKPTVFQVQIKRRITPAGQSEHMYQLLYPSDRKGEGLLIRIHGQHFSGARFTTETDLTPLSASDRSAGIFGTALTVDDIIADYLDWPQPTLLASEKLGNIPCHIVQLTAPTSSATLAKRVQAWIDEKRMVTQRIVVFGSNQEQPIKIVQTDKVLRSKSGDYIPASFTVTDTATGATTSVEATRSDTKIQFTDADFADEALRDLKVIADKD